MSSPLERFVVLVRDDDRVRRVMGSATIRRVRASSLMASVDRARRRVATRRAHHRDPHRFDSVSTVMLVIGPVKSGGTMLGALVDAHPDALVADEIDVVSLIEDGLEREQVFHLLEKGSRREALKGRVTARRLDPYSFAVPGAQGASSRPVVLGTTRGGPTTRRLGDQLDLLDRVEAFFAPARVRYLHVVRSPFDPISAMVRRGGRSVEAATEDFRGQCRRLLQLRERLGDRVLEVRYEDFVADPVRGLRAVHEHLGLEATDPQREATTAVIDADRPGERTGVVWTTDQIAAVEALTEEFRFLEGYRWA